MVFIKTRTVFIFLLILILSLSISNAGCISNQTSKQKQKRNINTSGKNFAIFPDEYSELDDIPIPLSTEDEYILKHLEKARQNYLQAMNFIQLNDSAKASAAFEEALQSLNNLVSFPGIEQNEDFTDIAQMIIDDYENFIKNLDHLDENSPFFIIRDKFFQQIEKSKPRTFPDIQSITITTGKSESNENVIPGLNPPNAVIQTTIPLTENDYVAKSLTFLTENPGKKFFSKWLERSTKWFPMMKKIASEELVPEELIYLSMIESGLNPNAVSRSKAVGLWQFIRTTGELYGLNDNPSVWVDERRDPEKSTHAAFKHLRDLYNDFGDWHLALAAYNCGAGGVRRAMKKIDKDSLNFWEIREKLPFETRNYVPLYIAATKIALSPQAYGFDTKEFKYEDEYKYDTFTITEPVGLEVLDKCLGSFNSPGNDIKSLNPELIGSFTPPDVKEYTLKIPYGSKKTFAANYASLTPEEKKPWQIHIVSQGETISKIAKKYGISKADLMSANDLSGYKVRLQSGTKLKIPIDLEDYLTTFKNNSDNSNSSSNNQSNDHKPVSHIVKKGETLFSIANFYNLSISELKKLNNIPDSTDNIQIGSLIYLSKDTTSIDTLKENNSGIQKPETTKIHNVKEGETLSLIADEYKVSIDTLIKLNNFDNENVEIGQSIKIPEVQETELNTSPKIKEINNTVIIYKSKKGESLKSIAAKFKVSIYDLKQWNKNILKINRIEKGTKIKIYTSDISVSHNSSHIKDKNKKGKNYTIRKGDTLSSISKKFHVSISSLKKANKNISGENIRQGQTIIIK